jgi:hypothetical protein
MEGDENFEKMLEFGHYLDSTPTFFQPRGDV